MGIRVYIRNTADVTSENEICLGKLYAYAELNDTFKSVEYMLECRCYDPLYYGMFYEYHYDGNDPAEHVAFLISNYLDYGNFARFHDNQIFDFVRLFGNDWNMFWGKMNYNTTDIIGRIIKQNNQYKNYTWEIRQGA